MKKYRILYWLGSIKTEYIVKANSTKEAEKKFIKIKGDKDIIDIEELSL